MKRTSVINDIEKRQKSAPTQRPINVVSTGSTLLDLAISGGVYYGGGIPSGNLVEIFGPSGTGKTVMLCEIAGNIQRAGGKAKFMDPEARLNNTFAGMFGLQVDEADYTRPNTVPEVFQPVREWDPEPEGKVHGVFADSLAALSTDMEMGSSDKMGTRRAKEFSEELRKTCRVLANKDILMVCSNQVRENVNAMAFAERMKTPGGQAIPFYASLRLQTSLMKRLQKKKKVFGKEHGHVYGILVDIKVYKSSIWEPYHTAPVYIIFDYGIDDIRANLQYLKDVLGLKKYELEEQSWVSMDKAIQWIEENNKEEELRKRVIEIWNEIRKAFSSDRISKRR